MKIIIATRLVALTLLVNFAIYAALPPRLNLVTDIPEAREEMPPQIKVAKPTFLLSGIVTDITDARMQNAILTIAGDEERKIIADDEGFYKVELPLGTYTITAWRGGFCAARRPAFHVLSSANIKFDFTLVSCPIANVLQIKDGQYTGESDVSLVPYKEEMFPVASADKPSDLLIQYGKRSEDENVIQYAGFTSTIHYQYSEDPTPVQEQKRLKVIINYNLLTIRAKKVRLNKKTLDLELEGDVVIEDNKEVIEAELADVIFKAGVAVVKPRSGVAVITSR